MRNSCITSDGKNNDIGNIIINEHRKPAIPK
jgi:hypothetical protein